MRPTQPAQTLEPVPVEPTAPAPAQTVPEADRESLEQLVQLVSPGGDTDDLTDEELTDLIMDEIEGEADREEAPRFRFSRH